MTGTVTVAEARIIKQRIEVWKSGFAALQTPRLEALSV